MRALLAESLVPRGLLHADMLVTFGVHVLMVLAERSRLSSSVNFLHRRLFFLIIPTFSGWEKTLFSLLCWQIGLFEHVWFDLLRPSMGV